MFSKTFSGSVVEWLQFIFLCISVVLAACFYGIFLHFKRKFPFASKVKKNRQLVSVIIFYGEEFGTFPAAQMVIHQIFSGEFIEFE